MSFKPTTPTSAGFAQVFDSSGMVSALYEDRQNKRKTFDKNVKTFDPSTVWHRDMPQFTKKVNEYYSYISDEYDSLANPSRNVDKWQVMREMENDLYNMSASSKAMSQQVDQAQKRMMSDWRYDTPENQDLINSIITGERYGGLAAGYESGEAFNNNFMTDFGKNIVLDTKGMTKELQGFGVEGELGVPRSVDSGRRMEARRSIDFNQEDILGKIQEWWTEGHLDSKTSGADIQKKYGGDITAFAEDVQTGLRRFGDPETWTKAKDGDGGGATESKFFISPTESAYGSQGQHMESVTQRKSGGIGKNIAGALGATTTTNEPVNYQYSIYTDADVSVGGTQTVYAAKPGTMAGYDLDGNVWSNNKLTNESKARLSGASYAYTAQQNMVIPSITMKDAEGNDIKMTDFVVKKGTLLSPEMIAEIKGNGAFVADGGANPTKISSGMFNDYISYGQYAFFRSTSDVSGMEMADQTSLGNIDEKQYRGSAVKWEDWKKHYVMPADHIANIEAEMDMKEHDNVFQTPISKAAASGSPADAAAAFMEQF